MDQGDKPTADAGQDYSTLLRMGWTPDSVLEAVDIAADLLRSGELDAALLAVESARGVAASNVVDATAGTLELVAFEIALRRGDATRAIGAANALRLHPGTITQAELERVRSELGACESFRPELREALRGVLDAVPLGEDAASDAPGLVFPRGSDEVEDDDLPYLVADVDAPVEHRDSAFAAGGFAAGEVAGNSPWAEIPDASEQLESLFGEFPVGADEGLASIRARFLDAAALVTPEHARDSCETGWSFFLMEDFEAAAVLFEQALGDPDVRAGAAEGLVRCQLNLSRPLDAVAFLERLATLCFAERLPDSLRYWYGRAAEAAGDGRKARNAYRSLPPGAFPDVAARLAAFP